LLLEVGLEAVVLTEWAEAEAEAELFIVQLFQ
jgi:hypothetical protein